MKLLDLTSQLSLELARPAALVWVLAALLVWWFLARTPRVKPVASTFLWQRVAAGGRSSWHSRRWLLALLVLATLALTRPELVPVAPPGHDGITLRLRAPRAPYTATRAEGLLPAGDERDIELWNGEELLVRSTVPADPDHVRGWRAELPTLLPGTEVTLSSGGAVRHARMPDAFRPIRVRDRSDSIAMAVVLGALADEGWVTDATDGDADVVVARAGTATSAPALWVPDPDSETLARLPIPDEDNGHPLLAGLDPGRWTIERLRAVPMRGPALLDSRAGPLISGDGRSITLGFLPEESDLPRQPVVWPVFIGRCLEQLTQDPLAAAPPALPWPARTPAMALLVVALLLVPLALAGQPARLCWVIAGLLVVALVWPAAPLGQPARVRVSREQAGDPDALHRAAGQLPDGGFIELADATQELPLAEVSLLTRLRARGIAVVPPAGVAGAAGVALRAWPRRVELDAEVTVVPRWGPAPEAPARTVARAPDGSETVLPEGTPVHRPGAPGTWIYELRSVDDASVLADARVVVEGRIPTVVVAAGSDHGSRQLLTDPAFDVEWRRGSALAPLPDPPERGLVLWDGVDPATRDARQLDALEAWIDAGGTLALATAPPFHEPAPGRARFDALLPMPLPPPPRRQEVSLGIVLLDASGSMREGGAASTILAGVRTLLDETPAGGRWGIAAFRDRPAWIAAPGTPVTDELLTRFHETSARLGGGTHLDRALDLVLEEFQHAAAGRRLIVLSDGRPAKADWQRYGARLRAADVEVWTLTVGTAADPGALTTLATAAGGTHLRLPGPRAAARSLGEVVTGPGGPWRTPTGELRSLSADPLLRGVPRFVPAPLRCLTPAPDLRGRLLLGDARGQPLLAVRTVGRGRVLQWLSGFDADSLPAGRAGERLVSTLTSVLVNATRERPTVARRREHRHDANGTRWLVLERWPSEMDPVVELHGSDGSVRAVALDARHYCVPLDDQADPAAADWRWPDGSAVETRVTTSEQRAALERIAGCTRGNAPDSGRLSLDLVAVLALLALLLAAGRRTFPEPARTV